MTKAAGLVNMKDSIGKKLFLALFILLLWWVPCGIIIGLMVKIKLLELFEHREIDINDSLFVDNQKK